MRPARARLLGWSVVLLLAMLGALVVVVVRSDGTIGRRPATPARSAPSAPPVRVCGDQAALAGPSEPPQGAVRVRTTQHLGRLTKKYPPGTTFWLTGGVHRLGNGLYDQVRPKRGNVYLGAPGAILDGRRLNRFAFVGYAPDVRIEHLTVQRFGKRGTNSDEGVVNHDSAPRWVVAHTTVRDNAGAGVMLGSGNRLRDNCLSDNGQYGFSAYHPDDVDDIVVERNEVTRNNVDDWERRRPGCGCTGGAKFWKVRDAVVRENWVHDNAGAGFWADTNNAGFSFVRNYISDNDAEGIFYEASYNAEIRDNALVRNGLVKGPKSKDFPTAAVYLSEAGSDARVDTRFGDTLDVTGNAFTDNWSGVLLWENADRFAGSPANPSPRTGTLVDPRVTVASCNAKNIARRPYYDDCRWKTKNVRVYDNTFTLRPGRMGRSCRPSVGCGYNGILANWGTYPSWSPYLRDTVQEHIVLRQGNRFSRNVYTGPWRFVVHDQGTTVGWATWQAAPYDQDADSIVKP